VRSLKIFIVLTVALIGSVVSAGPIFNIRGQLAGGLDGSPIFEVFEGTMGFDDAGTVMTLDAEIFIVPRDYNLTTNIKTDDNVDIRFFKNNNDYFVFTDYEGIAGSSLNPTFYTDELGNGGWDTLSFYFNSVGVDGNPASGVITNITEIPNVNEPSALALLFLGMAFCLGFFRKR